MKHPLIGHGKVLLGLLLGLSLASCAPSQMSPAPRVSAPSQATTYEGPVENLAVINTTATYRIADEVSDTFAGILEQSFFQKPYLRSRFNLIERSRLDLVLKEKGLTLLGLVDPKESTEVGKLLGAKYVLVASVSSVKSEPSRVFIPGLGAGGSLTQVSVVVNLSLISTETGRIIARVIKDKSKIVPRATELRGIYASIGTSEGALRDTLREAVDEALEDLIKQLSS